MCTEQGVVNVQVLNGGLVVASVVEPGEVIPDPINTEFGSHR